MIHLHRHSEHSLLDGLGTATQYAERAVDLGQFALALTDHGTLSGILHHMEACEAAGLFPILGVEAYYRDNRLDHSSDNQLYYHMTLLAKGGRGWRSLMRIMSEAHASGFYYKPCIDRDLLEREAEDLVCLSACLSGYVPKAMLASDELRVKDHMKWMRKVFKDDYYVELMPHDIAELRAVNPMLVNWANEIGAPYVATIDTHFPYKEWAPTQKIAVMIARNSSFAKEQARRDAGEDVYDFGIPTLYLMSEAETWDAFKDYQPELPADVVDRAIKQTDEIALSIIEHPYTFSKHDKLPKVSESPKESEEMLMSWCREGMDSFDLTGKQEYEDQLAFEFGVLQDFGVIDYFVLVGDIVRYARSENILVEARGSVAGSLIAYLVGISPIDPIAYGLLFERFINPDRKGLPDIDLDFEHTGRDRVKQYVADKYGHDHVADIIAYQTFGSRSALQSVSRAFDIEYPRIMAVTKTIDDDFDGTIDELILVNDEVAKFATAHPEVIEHAQRLEGQVKARSKHAAGVIITDRPIDDYLPTERSKDGSKVTAWDDNNELISKYGLVKVDMLGVKGLTKWHTATDMIKERTGESVDLTTIANDDPYAVEPEVMEAIANGFTLGVWQFESRGITATVRKAQPKNVLDLTALSALYRPGPIHGVFDEATGVKVLEAYVKRAAGQMPVKYWHELCEPFLKETHGVLAYQEQVMKIVQVLGGLSKGEADDMRKAIGKLYRLKGDAAQQFMQQYHEKWMAGCADQGVEAGVAQLIWDQILPFGNYAFNKSHSATYSRRSYIDGWLKQFYPLEFYASLLSYPPSDAKKKANQQKQVIREAMVYGVEILPPDINDSKMGFTVTDEGIRFGLLAVRQVGDVAANEILGKQPFASLDDFEERITKRKCNKTIKTALRMSGAFDCFNGRDEFPEATWSTYEQDYLGIALTGAASTPELLKLIESNCHSEVEIEAMEPGSAVIVGGEIDSIKVIDTRRGQMAFVAVAFGANSWDVTVFNAELVAYGEFLNSGKPVMIRGRKDDRGKIVADAIELAERVADGIRDRMVV